MHSEIGTNMGVKFNKFGLCIFVLCISCASMVSPSVDMSVDDAPVFLDTNTKSDAEAAVIPFCKVSDTQQLANFDTATLDKESNLDTSKLDTQYTDKQWFEDSKARLDACGYSLSTSSFEDCRKECAGGNLSACNDINEYFVDISQWGFPLKNREFFTQDYPSFRQVTLDVSLEPQNDFSVMLTAQKGSRLLVLRRAPPPYEDYVEAMVHDMKFIHGMKSKLIVVRLPQKVLAPLSSSWRVDSLSESKQAALLEATRSPQHFEKFQLQNLERFIVFNAHGNIFQEPQASIKEGYAQETISIACGALEVFYPPIQADDQRSWYGVRQIVNGIELVGWTDGKVNYNWGSNSCANRIHSSRFRGCHSRGFVKIKNEQQQIEEIVVGGPIEPESCKPGPVPPPPSYIALDDSNLNTSLKYARRLKNGQRLFFLSSTGCESMRIEDKKLLIKTEEKANYRGNREITTWGYGFNVQGVGVWLTGPGGDSIEYVLGRGWRKSDVWGAGCSAFFRVVGGGLHQIHLIESTNSDAAYHPDDVMVIFTNRKSCQEHYLENPRTAIDDPEYRYVPKGMRLFKGC